MNPEVQSSAAKTRFADLHCDNVEFMLTVSKEKFALEQFKKVAGAEEKPLFATFSTRDKKEDYHIHLNWHLSKSEVKIRVGFYSGALEAEENEQEPFAEDAIQWLGKFFMSESVTPETWGSFSYPADEWRARIPLPIKIPLGSEPEVCSAPL
jgi:hypothetical protein